MWADSTDSLFYSARGGPTFKRGWTIEVLCLFCLPDKIMRNKLDILRNPFKLVDRSLFPLLTTRYLPAFRGSPRRHR